LFDPLVVA
ncbi:hypothetical protein MKD33_07930, partial [Chromobacterium piscinae]